MTPISQNDFTFITDTEAREYLSSVVESMMRSFGITRTESLTRINNSWSHVDTVAGEEDFMYHELPKYWAYHFYYGKDSFWWLDSSKRSEMGLAQLAPLPL